MTNPDISIVTPVFNSVRWIDLCLRSVRHVLQGRDYEHIVVDGGSTDGTLEFLQKQKDIRLIGGPDKGMYDALNKGMAAARGSFPWSFKCRRAVRPCWPKSRDRETQRI